MRLLEITVDNPAWAAAADQQADTPRAKWVATLSFHPHTPTADGARHPFGPHSVAAPDVADRVTRGLLSFQRARVCGAPNGFIPSPTGYTTYAFPALRLSIFQSPQEGL